MALFVPHFRFELRAPLLALSLYLSLSLISHNLSALLLRLVAAHKKPRTAGGSTHSYVYDPLESNTYTWHSIQATIYKNTIKNHCVKNRKFFLTGKSRGNNQI